MGQSGSSALPNITGRAVAAAPPKLYSPAAQIYSVAPPHYDVDRGLLRRGGRRRGWVFGGMRIAFDVAGVRPRRESVRCAAVRQASIVAVTLNVSAMRASANACLLHAPGPGATKSADPSHTGPSQGANDDIATPKMNQSTQRSGLKIEATVTRQFVWWQVKVCPRIGSGEDSGANSNSTTAAVKLHQLPGSVGEIRLKPDVKRGPIVKAIGLDGIRCRWSRKRRDGDCVREFAGVNPFMSDDLRVVIVRKRGEHYVHMILGRRLGSRGDLWCVH